MLLSTFLSRAVDQSPPGNRLHPCLDVIKSPLAQHREVTVHLVWYSERSSQTRHASTLHPISFTGRTLHCQEPRIHTWPGTHHEGPCLEAVPVVLLSAAPNSYHPAFTVAICHSYIGACFHLLTHRLLQQPPLRDECTSSRSSSVGPELLSTSDPENREIRPDLSCNQTGSSLAANPSSYSFQDECHHKKLSCGSSSRVLDRALPPYQRGPGEAQPTIGGTGSAPSPPFSQGTLRSTWFRHLIPTTVEPTSSRHSTPIRGAKPFQKETKDSLHAAVHPPLRIYVTSATSTTIYYYY